MCVHKAPRHGQRKLPDFLGKSRLLECMPATRTHGEVDGAPTHEAYFAHVGTPVDERHLVALLCQQRGQQ